MGYLTRLLKGMTQMVIIVEKTADGRPPKNKGGTLVGMYFGLTKEKLEV